MKIIYATIAVFLFSFFAQPATADEVTVSLNNGNIATTSNTSSLQNNIDLNDEIGTANEENLKTSSSNEDNKESLQEELDILDEDISPEQYEENIGELEKVSMEEVKSYINDTRSNKEYILNIGRATCYYCRISSEATKEFNILTGGVVKYFDVIDTVSAEYNYARNVVGIPGTPSTLRIKNSKIVSAWIGSIKSGQELYDIIFSKVANEYSNLLNVENNNGVNTVSSVYTVSSGNSNKLERISTGREFSSDKIFLRKAEKDTFNLNKQKNDNIVLPNTGEKGYNLLSLIGIFELIIVITTFFKREKIYNEKNG